MTYKSLFTSRIKKLISYAKKNGIKAIVTSKTRDLSTQARLYANQGAYPAAAPGRSQHQYGLAWDIVFQPTEYQAVMGKFWADAGFGWDGSDPVHFALFPNSMWAQILGAVEMPASQYAAGGGAADPFTAIFSLLTQSLFGTGLTSYPLIGGSGVVVPFVSQTRGRTGTTSPATPLSTDLGRQGAYTVYQGTIPTEAPSTFVPPSRGTPGVVPTTPSPTPNDPRGGSYQVIPSR